MGFQNFINFYIFICLIRSFIRISLHIIIFFRNVSFISHLNIHFTILHVQKTKFDDLCSASDYWSVVYFAWKFCCLQAIYSFIIYPLLNKNNHSIKSKPNANMILKPYMYIYIYIHFMNICIVFNPNTRHTL